MGGKGSGGRRVGSGRKPQNQAVGDLKGSRRTRARMRRNQNAANQNARTQNQPNPPAARVPDPSVVASDVQIPPPPGNLTLDELAEWQDLAPRAARQGTLNDSTMLALRDLCQARVLKDRLLRKIGDEGEVVIASTGNVAAHPLIARFTTLLQRVEAGMLRFKLSPMGKEMDPAPEKSSANDPFAEFDTDAGRSDTVN